MHEQMYNENWTADEKPRTDLSLIWMTGNEQSYQGARGNISKMNPSKGTKYIWVARRRRYRDSPDTKVISRKGNKQSVRKWSTAFCDHRTSVSYLVPWKRRKMGVDQPRNRLAAVLARVSKCAGVLGPIRFGCKPCTSNCMARLKLWTNAINSLNDCEKWHEGWYFMQIFIIFMRILSIRSYLYMMVQAFRFTNN
jgi:hypothetical protein